MVNYGGGTLLFSESTDGMRINAARLLDEVSALVIDIGTSSLRAGYAGDDTPKAIIPTSYGYHPAQPETDVEMSDNIPADDSTPKDKFAKIYLGQNGPSVWREGMEISNPIVDGLSMHLECFFNPVSLIYS